MSDQTRIGLEPHQPPDPRDHHCEWCESGTVRAVHRFELRVGRAKRRSQKYVFSCGVHKETAEQAVGFGPDN